MRSIGRVEAPRWLSHESPKAAGARTSEPIEIFCGNPMPGTANGRGPGKWGCVMISVRLPVDAAGVSAYRTSVPARDPDSPWDKLELF
jgi:hypothetical protein